VSAGADINARDSHTLTPLMISSMCGHVNTVAKLVTLPGCELDAITTNGLFNSALGLAVNAEHVYLSVQRKTAELENNTMIGASCAV
jgi:ankyrin repeat protein